MSELKLKVWEEKKRAVVEAERWNNLPKGQKYENNPFSVYASHSKPPMLMRCGQKVVGGTNYWESPKEMNSAILNYLVENWDSIYPEVIKAMRVEETKALQDCQTWVSEMQAKIDEVVEEPLQTSIKTGQW